ncbi:hypothetical protein ASPVEDRAFT_45316 [Aspergillus versicolor CBS 583.65]|uniref:Uncharacterized protein n=1 Tax=Aspergillus versicolor CBS 583.65 TaxID=1036611 RepID=A0A1L9PWL9_ASPVE|nr:uncharacterized protein ASPVEDRAFT_45316 [Aspergillus versicolor CBS 583.65]OJJ05853.1 hypothetical protein ASPVEDRAFT_45316 [Aspergillus versicolor CBS 583.65]
MAETKIFETDLWGEHRGRHPSMPDLKNRLSVEIREKLANEVAGRPGTAYVDYKGRIRKVADHGKLYDDAHAEELTFGPDGSDTGKNWHGWTTAHLKVEFDVESI